MTPMNEPQEQLKLLNGLADNMPIELTAGQLRKLLATALEEQRMGYVEQMKLLMDADMAGGLGDNLEKMFGQRECKICGTNPEKQRELVLAILDGKEL